VSPLDLLRLTPLMERTGGTPEVGVGLIDGPVAVNHPDLAGSHLREIPSPTSGSCASASSAACIHGTFVAGILGASRGSSAPAICPDCTLLIRPIFLESRPGEIRMPSATPAELARAIVETVDAGARVVNLSAALVQSSGKDERELHAALDYSAARQVIVVAAAGNQAAVGGTTITRHSSVIPVAACSLQGRPLDYTNLGNSIGRRGLTAPGKNLISSGADGRPMKLSGSSVAAPLVTGAIALLWSEFPLAGMADIKMAVLHNARTRRSGIVPPVLNVWAAYENLASFPARRP
jgi:subtilisin family serine protease